MNLSHMKYAITVAKTNSINKAAEELFVGAPAMSRAIKELESNLGVTLFERSAKGMFLTSDGKLFVQYAKKVLKEVDDIENIFKSTSNKTEKFSVCVPQASYIAKAFTDFSVKVGTNAETELLYKVGEADYVLNSVLKEDGRLGILRYAEQNESYYRSLTEEKGIVGELITEFSYVLLMNKNSSLNSKKTFGFDDLVGYTEITNPDTDIHLPEIVGDEFTEVKSNRILVSDCGNQFDLLENNPNTYMWASSVPKDFLLKYNLAERKCTEINSVYKDVLIHRADYKLTSLDKKFIEEVIKSKREVF